MVKKTFHLTYIAILVTFAVVIHTVEAALPLPMPVPGVRLGLANIITILTLILYGLRSALLVTVLRILLGSFFVGNFFGFGFWLSLAGGVASCLVMASIMPLVNRGCVGLISVSVLGAAAHNLAQILVASLIISNLTLLQGYYPILLLLAVPTGLFTGLVAGNLESVTRRVMRQLSG